MERYLSGKEGAEYLGITQRVFYGRSPAPDAAAMIGDIKGYTREGLTQWHAQFPGRGQYDRDAPRLHRNVTLDAADVAALGAAGQACGLTPSQYLCQWLTEVLPSVDLTGTDAPKLLEPQTLRIRPSQQLWNELQNVKQTAGRKSRSEVIRHLLRTKFK